jgi:hypothetical protein
MGFGAGGERFLRMLLIRPGRKDDGHFQSKDAC